MIFALNVVNTLRFQGVERFRLQMYTRKDASTFGRYVATLKMADGTIVNESMRAWLEEKGYTGGTGA